MQCGQITDSKKRCHVDSKDCCKYRRIEDERSYFSILPFDLFTPLMLYFSSIELFDILPELKTLPEFYHLFFSKIVWNELWKRDISTIVKPPSNIYEKYREILNIFNPFSKGFKHLAQNGYDVLLMPLLTSAWHYEEAVAHAAKGGQIELVKLLLNKGANVYYRIIEDALRNGHIDIVNFILEKYFKNSNILPVHNANCFLNIAARSGHIEIVKSMLERGANLYDAAMAYAAENNHVEIVELMLERGATDYNMVMNYAAGGGHIHIVKRMLQLGATGYWNAMLCAERHNNYEIAEFLRTFM